MVALRDPLERRRQAATLRATIRDALDRIAPMHDEPPLDAPPIPVVHISTERLGTAVAIRYPDGAHGDFISAGLREEHLAALVVADPTGLRRALAAALALAGPEVGEPLAVEFLGRGHRDAILVPGGPAAAIPWNAVPLRDNAGNIAATLSDVLGLRLAPAARLLAPPRAPAQPHSPCWIADPDLDAGRWEVSGAPRLSAAAPRAIPRTTPSVPPWPADTDWLHLSTHGETQARDPLTARLLLPGCSLTLADLLVEHRFAAGATVVAPACRSAQVDLGNFDEVMSIGHAFNAAGAETVIGGFWDLPDLATALIVARMYAHLETDRLWRRPEVALRGAQRWLRDQTDVELRREAEQALAGPSWMAPPLAALLALRLAEATPERPFADPFEWAGLTAISLRASA